MLRQLLTGLGAQDTAGRFTYSIVVSDNDQRESARAVVDEWAASAAIPPRYCVEPRQNIALARNRAVENAEGDFIAFIDDDEEPCAHWLRELVHAIEIYQADGVLGPVIPRFLTPPPAWILRGRFFERPSHATGTWLGWTETRTGNVLLRRQILADRQAWFREEYGGGGEDRDFFRRAIANGHRFVWCADATVHECVPPERCTRAYLLQRALQRGGAPMIEGSPPLVISLIAALAYAAALPVLPLFGQHVVMRYLVKECDHLGRLLTAAGLYRRGAWR